jgi:CRP-like cAMP-binding protein
MQSIIKTRETRTRNRLGYERHALLPLRKDCLWKIETGIVRTLTWLEDGTALTLGLWGAGDVVGKVLSTQTNLYKIECLTPVEVMILPQDGWDEVTENLLAHIQQMEELSIIRNHKTVEETLFKMLAWLAKKFGRGVDKGHILDLGLTHQDLADLLGTTRVTITRIITQLEQQGMINRLPRKQILVQAGAFCQYEF